MEPVTAYVMLGIFQAIVWVFFLLRLYVRLRIVRKPGWDDLLVGLSVCFYTAFTVFGVGIIANGLGTDVDDDPANIATWERGTFYFFFSELAFVIDSTLLRAACAVMLLRITGRTSEHIRTTIHVTVAVMVVYSTVFFFVSLFQCWPVSYFWTYMYPDSEGSCINGEHLTTKWTVMSIFFTIHSVVCLLSDWILGAVPFFMLKDLQMSRWKKVVVIILLSLGILAGVVALIRAPLIIHANKAEFWDSAVPVAATTAVEPVLGIVAICSATLMPLFKKGAESVTRRLGSHERGSSDPTSGRSRSGGSKALATLKRSLGGSSTSRTRSGLDRKSEREEFELGSKTAIVVQTTWEVDEVAEEDDGVGPSKSVEGEVRPQSRNKGHEVLGV